MRTKKIAAAAILVGAIAAAGTNPPGFMYGLYNCGAASGVTSSSACLQCCRSAYMAGTLQYDEWQDCRGFCQTANFPPPPTVPFGYRVLLWIFGR